MQLRRREDAAAKTTFARMFTNSDGSLEDLTRRAAAGFSTRQALLTRCAARRAQTLEPGNVDAVQELRQRKDPAVNPDFVLPTCEATLLPDQETVLCVSCSAGAAELRVPAGAVACPTRVCLAVRVMVNRAPAGPTHQSNAQSS